MIDHIGHIMAEKKTLSVWKYQPKVRFRLGYNRMNRLKIASVALLGDGGAKSELERTTH